MAVEMLDLSDAIARIQLSLGDLGIAKLQRAYCQVGGELVPTGDIRWRILDEHALKQYLVLAVGRERAIVIGRQVATADDGLKIHRMIEQLQSAEVLAFQEVLSEKRGT